MIDREDIGKELARAVLDSNAYSEETRQLALKLIGPPATVLPDVEVFTGAWDGDPCIGIRAMDRPHAASIRFVGSSDIGWKSVAYADIDDIRPLHPDADELRATVDQLTDALRQSTQSRLDDSAKHAAERDELQKQLNAAHVNIRELQNNVVGRLNEAKKLEQELADHKWKIGALEQYAENVDAELAARQADRELMADVESLLDSMIASDPEGFGFGFMPEGMSARELLARVRAASDPKPPMPTTLVERCIKRLSHHASRWEHTTKTNSSDRELIAELQRYGDPVPGITREQAESAAREIMVIWNSADLAWTLGAIKAVLFRELGERSVAEDPHPQYTKDTGFSPECEV